MTTQEFVQAIKAHVIDSAVRDVSANLESPPGRRPPPTAVAASLWFRSLPEESKQLALYAIREAAEYSAFGFCCVLDGVRVIERTEEKSEFRLICVSPTGTETVLNPPEGEMLHDVLNLR